MSNPLKIPYFQTSIRSDLLVTLLLTPLWWVLGLNILIYQAVAFFVFLKLVVLLTRHNRPLLIPGASFPFFLFLCSFLLSILINIGNHPTQRILASFNNYLMFVTGLLLIVIIYNVVSTQFFLTLFKVARILCLISAFITLLFLGIWFSGFRSYEIKSLLARLYPSLLEYPFYYFLLTIRITATDWLLGEDGIPRISIYSHAHTVTGDFMVLLLPLMVGYCHLKKESVVRRLSVFFLSLFPLVFSLSRTAICAFLGALVLVEVIDKNKKLYFSFACFCIAIFASSFFYGWVEWLLNLRPESTMGRFLIYQEAIKTVAEQNIWMGIGIRLREEFTMMAVGSHSTYLGLVLATGVVGLSLFIFFQITVFSVWYAQKSYLKDDRSKVFWKYLGMSYIGTTGTLITGNVDAVPLMAYGYFFIIACLLSFNRFLKLQDTNGF